MEKKIFKYQLGLNEINRIPLPIGAEILTVQVQNNEPVLYALVDPRHKQPVKECIIEIYGTGYPIQCNALNQRKYISTFQLYGGGLVFHAFHYLGL